MRVIFARSRAALAAIVFVAFLPACGGQNYRPVVDPKGANMTYYEQDLVECQAIAGEQSVAGEAMTTAGVGAVAGAAVGALTGAIFGDAGAGAAAGAALGGGQGAIDGALTGLNAQEQIVANCMAGRGYKVLR